MNLFEQPRYKETPVKLFFEFYVLHVLRLLPEESSKLVQSLNLKKLLKTESELWYEAVPEALHISPTMEVAIWDTWIHTKEEYISAQKDFKEFAIDFTDCYMSKDTKIDKWTNTTYKAAADRVNNYIQNAF